MLRYLGVFWVALMVALPCFSAFAVDFQAKVSFGLEDKLIFGEDTADDSSTAQRVNFKVIGSQPNEAYMIVQSLIDPLRNQETGEILRDVLEFSTVPRFNSVDQLLIANRERVSDIEDRLFSSSGNDVEFEYDYYYDATDVESGIYKGRLLLRYMPESGMSIDQYIDVELNIDSSSTFKVSTVSGSASKLFVYPTDEGFDSENYVEFEFSGLASGFTLIQSINGELFNINSGKKLDLSQLYFRMAMDKDNAFPILTPLNPNVTLIDTEEKVTKARVYYELDNATLTDIEAGIYSGDIIYSLSSHTGKQYFQTIPVDIEVPALFNLDVDFDDLQGFDFRDMIPGGEAVERTLTIKVESNKNVAYDIVQKVTEPMTDQYGVKLPESSFRVKAVLPKYPKGKSKVTLENNVKTGDTVIYSSDANGSVEEFELVYILDIPRDGQAGDYSTDIAFSLVER